MMKKILFAIVALATAVGFTSCGSDGNGDDKDQDITQTIQNLSMSAKTSSKDGALIYDCDFTAQLTAKYGSKTMTLALNDVKFSDKMPAVNFVIDHINFSQDGLTFKIEPSSVSASAGYAVTGLKGQIDTEHNVYNISFMVNGTYKVQLSSLYNCSQNHYESATEKSYALQLSSENGKRKLRFSIHNVKFVDAMPTLKEMAVYFTDGDDCTISSTATGYTFECGNIVPYYKSGSTEIPMPDRKMSNVKGEVDLVNRTLSIEFYCFGQNWSDSCSLYL